ncbi:phosphoribosylformylglycinamidine cyclo-ligase [Agrilactobacillus composti DSM 18527 = JCM 14202]|uniref:Phosphoribosylformylglycinamidine cyclo-ligase n=1 Tax=Agrilactobacillus composti DSM 18527 = JCM 14202 TaxID=1423734 RepID=X0PFU4_9LACO|nr:phosphoribosylformylglycinamidine cyclo-ligase [Agrilactobacillus composti]KRM33339.1 phosphoribosylformylglycinamidine cyclo-ligase [Agrilactobacillus composti DSM 18527 = JCM 14202]GAF40678.1 phosphoribosylformylglycinamidine cyclo-ligase [Agrilactobacillus composti DSM 18527 = JCM 14202]
MSQDAYKAAGVDIAAGDAAVAKIAALTKDQKDPHVLGGIGGFGALYELPTDVKQPVLVSGSDGVGTKLLVAIAAHKHDTIGEDLVAMCVNDILAQGAKPLYFLDYLGIHGVDPAAVAEIVAGVQAGCAKGQLALIGGETAEMPDMYAPDHYDLAGFAVGLVAKAKMLTPDKVAAGDVLLGLPSSGLHSNGFSLIRQLLFKDHDFKLDALIPALGQDLASVLLTPTRIYTPDLLPLLQQDLIAAAAHITGGGLVENLPRAIPADLAVTIDWDAWQVPAVFTWLQALGQLTAQDMLQTFNLGIGMTLMVHPKNLAAVTQCFKQAGTTYFELGQVTARNKSAVEFTGKAQV